MLPDYITNDKDLQSLPNKDEIIKRQKTSEEEIVKKILMAVYQKATQDIIKNEETWIHYSDLKILGFQPFKHLNIIVEFLTSKGFKVDIKDNYSAIVVSV